MEWMLYGASGYTGKLTAELAVARGERPILAGRTEPAVRALAERLGLPWRAFALDDEAALRKGLEGVAAVVHMAGPFSATARPMLDACLAARAHYLDITGEIAVFEEVLGRGAEAERAGIVLLPGAGFDVVPTDCAAAMVAARLPGATHLELGFGGVGSMSRGTARTMVESMHQGGAARVDGRIVRVPTVWKVRELPLPHGRRTGVTIAWGDVSTAFHSTGIPNVCVYLAVGEKQLRRLQVVGRVRWLLRPRFVQALLKRVVDAKVEGPSAEARAQGYADVWAEARRPDGAAATVTMTTPEGYTLTADASLRALRYVLAGRVAPGAWTPSRAFGADFVRELDGVTVHG